MTTKPDYAAYSILGVALLGAFLTTIVMTIVLTRMNYCPPAAAVQLEQSVPPYPPRKPVASSVLTLPPR